MARACAGAVLGSLIAMTTLLPPVRAVEPVAVGTYRQEMAVEYAGLTGKAAEVHAIEVASDEQVYAGTSNGLYRLDRETWVAVPAFEGKPVSLLAAVENERLLLACDGAVMTLSGKRLASLPGKGPFYALNMHGNQIALAGQDGLWLLKDGQFVPDAAWGELSLEDRGVFRLILSPDGTWFAAAEAGLFRRKADEHWEMLFPQQDARRWAPEHVAAAGFDGQGRLWFAAPQGVGCLEAGRWQLYQGADGLPYNAFTSIAFDTDGRVWLGTERGAICFDGRQWAYREGRRWLPDNRVRDVAVARDGTAYFATPKGVGVIQRRPMRLADKARFFEDEIDRRHRRTPFEYVLWVGLEQPGDTSRWTQHDDDNDGQWTGMYGAAECFAYAATKDPKAKQRATKAFEALRFFSQVTQGGSHPAPKGFIARTILPTSGPDPNTWPWKCDTSSDELDGHYFLYARYYDLVAETEEEKDRVREVVRNVTDHLLEHDFRLVDWDGRPTRWANFSPESLNKDPSWSEERGINSLSILSFLRIAAHVTGDAKYDRVADELVREHGYATNCLFVKKQRGPGSFTQFDEEMALMNYYSLMQYEKDPELRQIFAQSCYNLWELEACELNSFYNFSYAACCQNERVETHWGPMDVEPGQACLDDAVETLKRYPMNLLDWRQSNSHRLDLVPLPPYRRDPGKAEGLGCRVDGTVLPIDERFVIQWSDDAWELNSGGQGKRLATGSPFLLAYYMGLYHGFIVEK
jgi:hypothetical protein